MPSTLEIARSEASPVIADFIVFLQTNENKSKKTIEEYYLDLRMFFRFLKRDRGAAPADTPFDDIPINDISIDLIRNITKADINNFVYYLRAERTTNAYSAQYGEHNLGVAAAKRKIACLKTFFGYLCEATGQLDKNPTLGVSTPGEGQHIPVYLSESDCRKLLSSISGTNEARDYCIILIFLTCGLRVSELAQLNVQDIRGDEEEGQFISFAGKGGKSRQVFLSAACVSAIKDWLEIRPTYNPLDSDKNALFLSRKHNRISVDAVQALVKSATAKAGVKTVSPHKLRHTAATLMLENGVDTRTLQEVLGHSNLNTTQIYTHVNSSALRVATAANPVSRMGRPPKMPKPNPEE